MLSGKVPYTGDSAVSIGIKHLTGAIPDLPPGLNKYQPLLNKLLAKNPEHRFQSGEEIIAAIDGIESGTTIITQPATVATQPAGFERTVVLSPSATTAKTEVIAGRPKGRTGLLVAAAVVVAVVAGAAFFALRKPATPPVAVAPAPGADAPLPADESAARAAQIAQFLSAADDAARAGQVLGADGAVSKYRQVLVLDSANPRAARALNEIAGQFIAQAERAIEKNSLDQAETFLKQAEEADSSHPMLFSRRLALNEMRKKETASKAAPARSDRKPEVATRPLPAVPSSSSQTLGGSRESGVASAEELRARETREREQQLQALLSRFQELVMPASLSATRAGLAQDLLAEATRLAPNDSRVHALPGQLADAYLKLATTKAAEKEYQEAETLIRRGLELSPAHPQLQALRKDIADKKSAKRPTFGSF
jgi:tetratricopeptide (TPR) repeat protein